MAKTDYQKISQLYAGLMAEVKERITAIGTALNKGHAIFPPLFIQEFCFLQLWMICETIAIGCLLAHEDINARSTRDIVNQWRASKIMSHLGRLNPNFFPRAITIHSMKIARSGLARIHWSPKDGGFLTKDEFVSLYNKSGDMLHRGEVKKLMKRPLPPLISPKEIGDWANKILALLDHHDIKAMGPKIRYICVMESSDHGGDVCVTWAPMP